MSFCHAFFVCIKSVEDIISRARRTLHNPLLFVASPIIRKMRDPVATLPAWARMIFNPIFIPRHVSSKTL